MALNWARLVQAGASRTGGEARPAPPRAPSGALDWARGRSARAAGAPRRGRRGCSAGGRRRPPRPGRAGAAPGPRRPAAARLEFASSRQFPRNCALIRYRAVERYVRASGHRMGRSSFNQWFSNSAQHLILTDLDQFVRTFCSFFFRSDGGILKITVPVQSKFLDQKLL